MWWWSIVFTVFWFEAFSQHLIGYNVCTEEQRYTVTAEKITKKNVTQREFVWCLGIPPRCSKYRTVVKDEISVVEEERTKLVQKCCSGYREDSTNTYCVPVCSICIHGECVGVEQCECNLGYIGSSCDLECPGDRWGKDCQNICKCKNQAACNPETGSCHCTPDWTGSLCETALSNISRVTTTETVDFQGYEELKFTEALNQPSNPTSSTERVSTEVDTSSVEYENIYPTSKINNEVVPPEESADMNNNEVVPLEESADMNNTVLVSYRGMRISYEKDEHLWPIKNISNQSKKEDVDFISIICFALGFATFIIFIAVISVLIVRYKSKKLAKKCISSQRDDRKNDFTQKPIIYRTTFHAPLPDPPVFQNPAFTLVSDEVKSKSCAFQNEKLPDNNFEESVEADVQYDYPPSTGSYRAASIPDPDLEPLYDEIPSNRRPVPAVQTKFQHINYTNFDLVETNTINNNKS